MSKVTIMVLMGHQDLRVLMRLKIDIIKILLAGF